MEEASKNGRVKENSAEIRAQRVSRGHSGSLLRKGMNHGRKVPVSGGKNSKRGGEKEKKENTK